MHGTFRTEMASEAPYWPDQFSVGTSESATAALPLERSEYGARRFNWPLIAIILASHAALLTMLVMFDVIPVKKLQTEPLVIELLEVDVAPPPEKRAEKIEPVEFVTPQMAAPVPIVKTPSPPPQLVTVPNPPPPPPVVTPPAPATPISVSDLGAKIVDIVPPRYPLECRRKKQQGTVLLMVVLNADGTVANVRVSQTSGHRPLDKAALEAVRRWRWSPTVRDGEPVMVQGLVDIPFILKA
ncbi:MAG: energy transducer TonB [Sphingomonadaceae bacterium]